MSFTIFLIFFLTFKAVCFVVHNSNLSNLGKILCNLDFFSFKFHWYTLLSLELGGHYFLLVFYFLSFFWVGCLGSFFFKKGVLGELSLYLFYFQDSVSVSRAPSNVLHFFVNVIFYNFHLFLLEEFIYPSVHEF